MTGTEGQSTPSLESGGAPMPRGKPPWRERLLTLAARPAILPVAMVLGVGLTLGSLWAGFHVDDYFHRAALLGPQRVPALDPSLFPGDSPLDMFRFLDGDPEHVRHFIDLGMPWWTYPRICASFMRPLAALTHKLDYWAWPDSAVLMHAHSVAWFALLILVVGLVHRRFLGLTAAAGLATLLYAIDDARAVPVGWLANRNALPAAVFGMAALLAHDRWRRQGRIMSGVLAYALTAISLLSAEAGVGTFALIGAHLLCLDPAPLRRRAVIGMGYLALLAAWRITWRVWGFGVTGMGIYVDPIGEPLLYLQKLAVRIPLLLMGQWSPAMADLGVLVDPDHVFLLALAAVAVCVWVALFLRPLLQRDPVARFFACVMLLALPPVAATAASNRSLLFSGVGAMGLLGQVFADWLRRRQPIAPGRSAGAFRWLAIAPLLLIHLVLAPPSLAFMSANPVGAAALRSQVLPELPTDDSLKNTTIVVINGPSPFHVTYIPIMRALDGLPGPRRLRILGPAREAVEVRRSDERTLILRPDRGFLRQMFDQLYRGENHRMQRGETIRLSGLVIEVTDLTPDGRPAEIACRFEDSLDDPMYQFIAWRDYRYRPWRVPRIGQAVTLPPCRLAFSPFHRAHE